MMFDLFMYTIILQSPIPCFYMSLWYFYIYHWTTTALPCAKNPHISSLGEFVHSLWAKFALDVGLSLPIILSAFSWGCGVSAVFFVQGTNNFLLCSCVNGHQYSTLFFSMCMCQCYPYSFLALAPRITASITIHNTVLKWSVIRCIVSRFKSCCILTESTAIWVE